MLISGFGTSITVDRRRLIINKETKHKLFEVYPHWIHYDNVIIDGNCGLITFEALRWLVKYDIVITTLNCNGNLLSVTLPKETLSPTLRVKQYLAYLDREQRRKIALDILHKKIRKSLDLLVKLSEYYDVLDKSAINNAFYNVDSKFKDSEDLLAYEGNIAIVYWNGLQKVFSKVYPEFNFTNRNGRRHSWNMNASDEINALLNYGYATLEAEIRKDINVVGLDYSINFLHEIKDGKASLVYDIQELYRLLVDLSVIQLLEERKLKKRDFIVNENYNLRLRETTAKTLLDKITLNFNSSAEYKDKNHSYQFILHDNVRILENNVSSRVKTLSFNIPEIKIDRVDHAVLRNRILNMSPEERKKLSPARNTLFYMKKNLKDGKKIKVYNKVMSKFNQEVPS